LIIVVDATWRRARKMANHLNNVIGHVKHIKLETDTVSVYSRTQTQTGRICTIEAVALLLQELGEKDTTCKALINGVLINNQALRPPQTKTILYETGRGKFHPAWYFHTELLSKRERAEDKRAKEEKNKGNGSKCSGNGSGSNSSNLNNDSRPAKRAKR